MVTGVVKWFNARKGFGFIEHKDGDVFVHFRNINTGGYRTLSDGQMVSFDIVEGKKGLQAENVSLITKEQDQEDPKESS